MNQLLTIYGVIVAALLTSTSAKANPRSTVPMRDAVSHDDLARKLRMVQQKDPIRELGPAKGDVDKDPSLQNAERDIVANSTILSYNGLLTLVPKRAVLFIPEDLKSRVGKKEDVKITTFQKFLAKNRGWIRTMEVTRPQALGHVPFNEEALAAIESSTSIVIATFQRGPISVLPAKAPEEVPKPSEMKPVTYR